MPPSIEDVARLAGVSTATVSRVLANKPHVRDEVRERVFAAVEELGYSPSRVARSLRTQRSNVIGLIISDIQNPFFTSLVRAVEDIAYEHEHAVLLCNSDEDIVKETLYIDLMHAERVAGVIITPTRESDNPSRKLVEADIPVVAVDRRMLDIHVNTVVVDNKGAAYALVSHLIQDGHKRIGGIFGVKSSTTGRERWEGYIQALQEHGLPFDSVLSRSGLPKEEHGYYFARELLRLPEPPSAIFTGNNLLTIGALRAIHEQRGAIPDEIGLAGFDELDWMSIIEPKLTVIAQPTYELGQTAASLLLDRIQDGARPPQEVVLQATLIVRQSCARHQENSTVER